MQEDLRFDITLDEIEILKLFYNYIAYVRERERLSTYMVGITYHSVYK